MGPLKALVADTAASNLAIPPLIDLQCTGRYDFPGVTWAIQYQYVLALKEVHDILTEEYNARKLK